MKKEQVYALATVDNPIISDNGNKIEFQNGDVYVLELFSDNEYRKVKPFVL